jgi:ribosomal protein S6--L-glutamate ligase
MKMKNPSRWKLLLVGPDRDRYLFRRLVEEATRQGIPAEVARYGDFEISVDGEVSLRLKEKPLVFLPDAVILDRPRLYTAMRNLIAQYLLDQGILLLNGRSFTRWSSMNKLAQTYELQRAGIPIVPTQCFGSPSGLLRVVQQRNASSIIKSIVSAEGEGVYEVRSHSDLLGILSHHSSQHLLVQPMFQAMQEFRVIVLGDRPLGVVRKIAASGEFRANRAQGARFESVAVPDFIEDIAIGSCQALQCDFAGVDILYNGIEACWVLEVNRYAGFEGFEEATQINVASALLDWIRSHLK